MRVLIVGGPEVLAEVEAGLYGVLEYKTLPHDAYLHNGASVSCVHNHTDNCLNVCFGVYYATYSPTDSRWSDKVGVADVIIEFDTNVMKHLCGKNTRYVRLDAGAYKISDITVCVDKNASNQSGGSFDVDLTDEDLEELCTLSTPTDVEAKIEDDFGTDVVDVPTNEEDKKEDE